MKHNQDHEKIYSLLRADSDQPLPEALRPEAIAALVAQETVSPKPRATRRLVAIAAVLVCTVLTGALALRFAGEGAPHLSKAPAAAVIEQTATDLEDDFLRSASDYAEIEALFLAQQADSPKVSLFNRLFGQMPFAKSADAMDIASDGLAESAAGVTNDAAEGGVGQTNTQVSQVDEADILKNDGSFLYVAQAQSFVDIVDIRNPADMQTVATIDVATNCPVPAENGTPVCMVQSAYLADNLLVVLYAVERNNDTDQTFPEIARDTAYGNACISAVSVYDVSDRTTPQLQFSYAVDGNLLATRKIGNRLVLVTNYTVPMYTADNALKNACVPCFYTQEGQQRFPAACVKLLQSGETANTYLTVTLLDITKPAAAPQVKAVLGGGMHVYCSTDALLVTREEYPDAVSSSNNGTLASYTPGQARTRLYAFDLSNGVTYAGNTQLDGALLNQFSMDAQDGYYRIATTAEDGSLVTVLNRDLETVGAVRGIAKGEQIYAARFLGDTAYLVTFYQTDPLFVLDLKNPENPKIVGELKLPGFSNYLHPYSADLLIGIGQDGTDSGAVNQLKISLFDVHDGQNPKELGQVVYNEQPTTSSMVQCDHHAYLAMPESGEFAIPVAAFGNTAKGYSYISVLSAENGSLRITGTFPVETGAGNFFEILRVTFVGDTLFALTQESLFALDKTSGEALAQLRLSTTQEDVK